MAVSVREVAELAGVSIGTVSNVLNAPEKVTPATIERVQAAIQQLGFVRNDAARQLRMGASRTVGMIVLDLRNPFFADVARGAEERAAEAGLSIIVANSDERADREAAHLDQFEEQRVRGILISPVKEVIPQLERIRARGTQAVLVDRLATTPGFSSVSVNDVEGGRLAVQHLLDTGRRNILFVGGPLDLAQVRDRLRGARAAIETIPGARINVLPIGALSMRHGVDAGREILAMTDRPDAIFAANDLVALGVLQGVAMIGGIGVPDQLSLIGYDDIDFSASAGVPISSIRQPREKMGAMAVELLLAAIGGERVARRIVLQPELVVRESSRA